MLSSSEKHVRVRSGQSDNAEKYHHPDEKMRQLRKFEFYLHGEILEVFGGAGNLSGFYQEYSPGHVCSWTKAEHNSFDYIYQLRANKRKFDVIDIDSYGYPDLFFPVVFEMMADTCLLVFTFPIIGVNCLNGIMEQHFITFWHSDRPTIGDVTGVITDLALRNWYLASLRDVVRIWRFVFVCERVKATEMCHVRNRK